MPSLLMHKRIAVLGAVLTVAAGATAGAAIGSPATRSDNITPIQQAITKTSKASSERVSFTLSISTGSKSSPTGTFAIGGSGVIDNRHKTADVTVDLGALAAALGGVAGGTVPQKIDVRIVKNTVYALIPGVAKTVAPGKTWLKLDSSSVSSSSTGVQLKNVSPKQVLDALTKATAVHNLGSTKIGGSPVTHYQVQVDPAAAVNGLPKADRAQALKSIKQSGLTKVPLDVYVGSSGYLRRIGTSLAVKAQKGTPAASLKVTLDISDYGLKVGVHAPPAAQVADAGKLVTKLTAGLKHP